MGNSASIESKIKLLQAIRADDEVGIRTVLADGARPDWVTTTGETPLSVAADVGSLRGIRALVEAGAPVDQRPSYVNGVGTLQRGTALTRALESRKIDAAKLLLDLGANPGVPNPHMETALHLIVKIANSPAVRESVANEIIFRVLDKGVGVDRVDSGLQTPLMVAIRSGAPVSTVKLLLERGADPSAMNAQGMRPIHYIVNDRQIPHLTLLLGAGADVNSTCVRGRTALFYFREEGVGRALVNVGADVKHRCHAGETVLHYRLESLRSPMHDKEVLPFLLQAGAELDLSGLNGDSAGAAIDRMDDSSAQQYRTLAHAYRARQAIRTVVPSELALAP